MRARLFLILLIGFGIFSVCFKITTLFAFEKEQPKTPATPQQIHSYQLDLLRQKVSLQQEKLLPTQPKQETEEEPQIQYLAQLYTPMRPKTAAKILSGFPDDKVIQILSAMPPVQAGLILSAFPTEKAGLLSVKIAQSAPALRFENAH